MKSVGAVEDAPFLQKVFAGIEGIGVQTSRKLHEEFQTLESTMKAEKKDFTNVEGVGEKTAETIFSTLHSSSENESEEGQTKVFNI